MEESQAFIHNYLYEILQSPVWEHPVMSFIDSHCLDSEFFNESNSQVLYKSYQTLLTTMLNNLAQTLQVPYPFLLSSIKSAMSEPFYYFSFRYIRASYNFYGFIEILNARNQEITKEALNLIEREDTVIAKVSDMEAREEFELELALKNSIISKTSEENLFRTFEQREGEEVIKALELSAQEFIGNGENELGSLLKLKNDLVTRLKSEQFEKISGMTEEQRTKYESDKLELQAYKEKFNRSKKAHKRIEKREQSLRTANEKLQTELRWLEEECQNLEKALKLEDQRLENLNLKSGTTEPSTEPESPLLNKIQLKKVQNFSIQELLPVPQAPESPKSPSKPAKNPLEDELNAKKARYLKMKEMIKARKAGLNLPESEFLEKKPLPPLVPLTTEADLKAKQNFLKDII